VIVEGVRRAQKEHKNDHYGYNVLDDQYEDMVEAGIIDPAKVTRSALQNATSIAAMILTTEALITDLPEKERAGAPAMPEYLSSGTVYRSRKRPVARLAAFFFCVGAEFTIGIGTSLTLAGSIFAQPHCKRLRERSRGYYSRADYVVL
jgi:hypothetical protein